jgi:hypothetical protein
MCDNIRTKNAIVHVSAPVIAQVFFADATPAIFPSIAHPEKGYEPAG